MSTDQGPAGQGGRPLADRMRPTSIDECVGQDHILGPGKPLRTAIAAGNLHSMVLWGPPGTGKTTLARVVAETCDAHFINVSAVLSGVKDIRHAVDTAREVHEKEGRRTILFVDEAHRFNKSQQDAFLPHVEDGTVVFIGATTENPSFELNNALLSRVRVYVLKALQPTQIRELLDRAIADAERGLGGRRLEVPEPLRDHFAEAADGDARRGLNLLELAADLAEDTDGGAVITEAVAREVLAGSTRRFDKGGDTFYDQISALHKSVRGSSPDAALYWFARMLDGGCDPLYLARRAVRMASEDVGNADPRALPLALAAWDTQQRLGSPEGELAIAHALVYMACVPKSNAVYQGFNEAREDAANLGSLEVPLHLRNAPTTLTKELGHGREYRYAHDEPEGYAAGVDYFPDEMNARRYYRPVPRGLELKIRDRLEHLRELDRQAKDESSDGGRHE